MMKKDISANLYQKCFILCSKILLNVLYNLGFTILFPWQHTGFQTGHPLRSIFMFANGAWYPWSNKHMNMLAWVCGLIWRFSSWKSLTYWSRMGGDWKRVSCHSIKMCYSFRCVFYRTISLPSFNDLRCKLAKIALFTYTM